MESKCNRNWSPTLYQGPTFREYPATSWIFVVLGFSPWSWCALCPRPGDGSSFHVATQCNTTPDVIWGSHKLQLARVHGFGFGVHSMKNWPPKSAESPAVLVANGHLPGDLCEEVQKSWRHEITSDRIFDKSTGRLAAFGDSIDHVTV